MGTDSGFFFFIDVTAQVTSYHADEPAALPDRIHISHVFPCIVSSEQASHTSTLPLKGLTKIRDNEELE